MKTLKSAMGCLALLGVVGSAPAAQVFVGGPQGVVFAGDSESGDFQFFGTCGGPINSMAIIADELFLADAFGTMYVLNLDSELVVDSFSIVGDAAAMVVHDGDLLLASSDGLIQRINPNDGAVVDAFTHVGGVAAMTLVGDDLFVAEPGTALHRINAVTGESSYFFCSCFFGVDSLTNDGTNLRFISSGGLWTVDIASAAIVNIIWLPETGDASVMDGAEIVVGSGSGVVRRVNPDTGEEMATFATPIEIRAMVSRATPACPEDLSGDGEVDLTDLSMLLAVFGQNDGGDIDGDGQTSLVDAALLLAVFGQSCN